MLDRRVARIATTRPIQASSDVWVRVTTEALLEAAKSVNTRSVPRWSLEHDPYTVSLMKPCTARVEHGDEFDSLVIEFAPGQELGIITHDTEMEYVFLHFPEDTLPFTTREDVERLSVAVDLANFDKLGDFENFKSAVSLDGTPTKTLGRRSAIPDPIITVSVPVIVGFIAFLLLKPIYHGYSSAVSKLTERMILKTAEYFASLAMDKMNRKLKNVLTAYRNNQSVDERPILVERRFTSRDVNIVLLERIHNDTDIENVELQQLLDVLEETGKIICTASEITLTRNTDGKWQFWYLLTADGHVIATEEAMLYTNSVLSHMREGAVQKERVGDEREKG